MSKIVIYFFLIILTVLVLWLFLIYYHWNKTLKLSNKYLAEHSNNYRINSDQNVKIISSSIYNELIISAEKHPRKRKMTDLTKDPSTNTLQTLINTWISGSYSPVHRHETYSETFVVLHGALAFFTFDMNGQDISCTILHNNMIHNPTTTTTLETQQVLIIEKQQWHALTAAPISLGWPGYAVVFETNGRKFDPSLSFKTLAPFAPIFGDGMEGDPEYFNKLFQYCPSYSNGAMQR